MRAVIVLVALVFAAGDAHADRAATLNKQGIRAAERNDWELARQRFEQSYALDPRPLVLFNLAGAQEHTNKLLAARNSFQTFLELTAKSRDRDLVRFRKAAKTALGELATAIPTLQIRAMGLGTDGVVELDGHTMDIAILVKPVPVDPGEHKVLIVRRGEAIARREIVVARGDRKEIDLAAPLPTPSTVEPVAPPLPPAPGNANLIDDEGTGAAPPARVDSGGGSSKWLWGLAAVVALGAAAGAGYYYVIYEPPPADPTPGTLGGGIVIVP
jgi:hypothetical protein